MPSPPRIKLPAGTLRGAVQPAAPGASKPSTPAAPAPRPIPRPEAGPRVGADVSKPRAPLPTPPVPPTAPEPGIPLAPPAVLGDSKEARDWLLAALRAHEGLRTRSFYDTGHLIAKLLELRRTIGARDIKELCSKVDLGLSHMTANKYLQVARTFDRETAIRHGIEKCYALVVYAKATGRIGKAAAILAADESLRGIRGLRVSTAPAAQIYRAIRQLKEQAREDAVPPEERARAARTLVETERLFRNLGVRRATAELVRRHGDPAIALYIPLDVAETLDATLPKGFAKLGVKLAKTRPDLFAPLREAGWKPTARAG